MTTPTPHSARSIIARLTRIWAELDYAQRRLFEITTGIEPTRR